MIISNVLGTDLTEIEQRKFNIYLAISLGNSYFNDNAIKYYIDWMLKFSKEKVAILIADSIHAINYRVFSNLDIATSLIKAEQEGQIIRNRIEKIITSFYLEQASSIFILCWNDISNNEKYGQRFVTLTKEFESNDKFKNFIIKQVKSNLGSRCRGLSQYQYQQLASYLLAELAAEINGFDYKDVIFNLHPYPGKSISFFIEARDDKKFPELVKNLEINRLIGAVEGYIE